MTQERAESMQEELDKKQAEIIDRSVTAGVLSEAEGESLKERLIANKVYGREDLPPHNDLVNHPAHYTDGKIEVWDFIIDKDLPYCLGNVVKYVSRAGKKDPEKTIQDLEKAKAYLDRQIKLEQDKLKPEEGFVTVQVSFIPGGLNEDKERMWACAWCNDGRLYHANNLASHAWHEHNTRDFTL